MLKRIVRLVVALAMISGAIGVAALMMSPDNGESEPDTSTPTPEVSVLDISLQSVSPEARWAGRVVARQRIQLVAPTDLTVRATPYATGDAVDADAALFELDRTEAEQDLALVRSELDELTLNRRQQLAQQQVDETLLGMEQELLAQAERRLDRERGLRERGATTDSAVDEAQSQVIQARQAVRQREAALAQYPLDQDLLALREERLQVNLSRAEDRLDRAALRAPFAGIVEEVLVTAGQRVSAGEPMVTLYNPDQLFWRVDLPRSAASDMSANLAGSWVSMTRRSGSVQEGSTNRSGEFPVPDSLNWTPGEVREARVRWPLEANRQLIPGSALYSGNRVFLVDEEERLRARSVSLHGTTWVDDQEYWLIEGTDLPDSGQILLTRLPNALNGLQVRVSEVVALVAESTGE